MRQIDVSLLLPKRDNVCETMLLHKHEPRQHYRRNALVDFEVTAEKAAPAPLSQSVDKEGKCLPPQPVVDGKGELLLPERVWGCVRPSTCSMYVTV